MSLPLQIPTLEQVINNARSARLYCRAKAVNVLAVVVPKRELIDIKLEIFLAHLMERADDAELNDTPEAFDSVGVNRATYIFVAPMMHHAVREVPIKILIGFRARSTLVGQ